MGGELHCPHWYHIGRRHKSRFVELLLLDCRHREGCFCQIRRFVVAVVSGSLVVERKPIEGERTYLQMLRVLLRLPRAFVLASGGRFQDTRLPFPRASNRQILSGEVHVQSRSRSLLGATSQRLNRVLLFLPHSSAAHSLSTFDDAWKVVNIQNGKPTKQFAYSVKPGFVVSVLVIAGRHPGIALNGPNPARDTLKWTPLYCLDRLHVWMVDRTQDCRRRST